LKPEAPAKELAAIPSLARQASHGRMAGNSRLGYSERMESVPTNDPPALEQAPEHAPSPLAGEDDAVRYESREEAASSPAVATSPKPADDSREFVYYWKIPLMLLLGSMFSIFFAGCCRWAPHFVLLEECFPWQQGEFANFMPARVAVLSE